MALRYKLPVCSLADVCFTEEKSVPVRAVRAAVPVGFKTGADLKMVVEEVRKNRAINLDAACGSGKSVRVPLHLAKAMNMLVIHTVPSGNLAQSLAAYVATTTEQEVAVVTDVDSQLPNRGVVLISNADLVARMLSNRSGFRNKYILFMDESHESDCYTAVLRRIGPSQTAVERFITATATSGPDGFRKRQSPGAVTVVEYDDVPVVDWDVEQSGKPWSISGLRGNMLIFVEQRAAINHLTRVYSENGCGVYVLNARSTYAEHCAAMAAFDDVSTGINVILADYSYRSGFSISNFEHLIDTGKVAYEDVDPNGNPVRRFRNAYKFELEQAAGRAGRFPRTETFVARPRMDIQSKICDLEGVETDAAALIYRLFGLKPPSELKSSPFYSGKVPRDPVDALRSPIPLRCIAESQLVDWTECSPGSVERAAAGYAQPVVTMQARRVITPPVSVSVSRVSTPSPRFDESEAVLRVSPVALRDVSVINSRSGPNDVSLFVDDLSDNDACDRRPTTLSAIYDQYGDTAKNRAGVSYVRSRSGSSVGVSSHSRATSVSSVVSGSTVEMGSDDFEKEFARVMDDIVQSDSVLEPGKHYYYNSYCEAAPEKTMVFPGGVDSVMGMLRKPDAASVVCVLGERDKAYALSVLTDSYNEALAEMRAVKRIGAGFQEFSASNVKSLDKTVMRSWVLGLGEILAHRSLQVNAYARGMCDLLDHGYEILDSLGDLENKFIEAHVGELKRLTQPRVEGGAAAYRERMLVKAVAQSVNAPVVRLLEHVDDGGGAVYSKAARERPKLMAGQVRVRDMVQRSGLTGTEIGNVKYKLQPDTGLRSLWTRPLMKLIGQGNMKVEIVS